MPPKKAKPPKLTQTNAQFKEMFLKIEEYALGNTLGDETLDPETQDYMNKQILFMRSLSKNELTEEYLRQQIMMCADGEYFGLNNWMDLWKKYKPESKKTEDPKKELDDKDDKPQIDEKTKKKKKKVLD